MKKYIYIIIASLILALSSIAVIQSKKINKYKEDIEHLENTIDAYSNENSDLSKSNREFQITINNLNNMSDSLIQKLNEARKSIKIKDKEIKRLAYLASEASKKDTIRFTDTIFSEKMVCLDTVISDKNGWYRCNVGLKYPNEIVVAPTFKSEKCVITSSKRETINPPKKCWIGRLFQKKHNVVTIDVVESNPFITNGKERFIEIIK